jgi:hypothetical protein
MNNQWSQQTGYSNPYSQQQTPYQQNRVPQQQQQQYSGGQGYGQQAPQPSTTSYGANAYQTPYSVQQQYQQPQAQQQFGFGQQLPNQPAYQQPPSTQYSYGSGPYQQQQQGSYDSYNAYQRQSPATTQPSPYSAMNMQMSRPPVQQQQQPQQFKQNYDQSSQYYDNPRYQSGQQQRTRSPSPKRNFPPRRDAHRQARKRSMERHHSPPRKVEKRPIKEEKHLPYTIRLNSGPWNVNERQFIDVKRRYPNLHVVADFTKVINHWVKDTVIELDHPVSFECDNETLQTSDQQSTPEPASLFHGMKHNGKIMLMSGVDWKEFIHSLHQNPDDPDHHLHHLLRFLVSKKDRSGLMCVGGSWSQKVDGGDPLTDEGALLKTALRCAKEFVGVDLNKCTKWIKFLEIWYHRPAEVIDDRHYPEMEERTIIYVPDVWNALPNQEQVMLILL